MSTASVSSVRTSSGAVVRRKVDDRLKYLLEDVVEHHRRGLLLLVGDRAKDQVVNLHLMLSRANHNAKVNVLWCMKEDPDFGSTSRKRQERRARLEVKGGLATEATKEAFQTFLAQTAIRFCKYAETHKILGQTFGMAILQDFEAISPNTLARTMETVRGGGLIIVLFRGLRSLQQLHTIAMDVHARYRTAARRDVVPRFNERLLLSLADCDTALCVDDELTVLPLTQGMRDYAAGRPARAGDAALRLAGRRRHEADLHHLQQTLQPSTAVGPLVRLCVTMDQAKTVLALMQSVAEKSLRATCVVTAGRGRGKSAALGLAAAGAIAQGYSNIFCTAPSPENVQTLFEFAVRGLREMGYAERTEFEAMQSTHEDFAKCLVRINVFRGHRQTIQFISATDTDKFAQAELLILDEAAALPLTLVQKLMGPYLIFLSSTVSGYEGTGRSLSMKLVAELRRRRPGGGEAAATGTEARTLQEITLTDPIRYGPDDPVERWLHTLLCLDATAEAAAGATRSTCPHPSACELFYVDRDALFSYHPLAEALLQRIQALLVAAHYKNQPNDLQLLSDAPGHHLFVLCAGSLQGTEVPDIFCVVHACEEGRVSAETVRHHLSRGARPSGDLIPYTLSQYYLEEGFAGLAGLRIVRIATSPDLQRSGYGSRAVELLQQYYAGTIALQRAGPPPGDSDEDPAKARPRRAAVANLLTPLVDRPYEAVDYLGVSYGLTMELFNFWRRARFEMLYLRQTANELTGEHSGVMVYPMGGVDLRPLRDEFCRRFLRLLRLPFRDLPTALALSVLQEDGATTSTTPPATAEDLRALFRPADRQRLRLASTSFVDGAQILDLVPPLAELYFSHRLDRLPEGGEGTVLSHAQAAVLLGAGLQCLRLETLATQTAFAGVAVQQLRAFFQKSVARVVHHMEQLERRPDTAAGGEEAEENAQEVYDASGKLIGLSVTRSVPSLVSTDSTLLRDASTAVPGGKAEAPGDLQNVFRRPKKRTKRPL